MVHKPIPLLLLFVVIIPVLLLPPSAIDNDARRRRYSFTENCADAHDKDFVSCVVISVDCNIDLAELIPPHKKDSKIVYPSEAHDIRIETFAKANGGGQTHQLLVDITWQTPPNNFTHALKAFLLEIEGQNERKHACFLLNVSGTEWTTEKVAQSPRLHFASNSLFSFSQTYEVELYSLPEQSTGAGASVHTRFTTPQNPSGNSAIPIDYVPANCSKHSNQFASKWTAGFRHIYVHSAARVMQVQFVGAPPQYCFESYEVRLLDETGLELLFSGTVLAEEMHRNGSMIIGQYNFTDLEYDRMYIPSVIPVERAVDGRCLCPVFGIDPYDVKVVCSCVAADWRPVRMTRPDVVKLCFDCASNQSIGLPSPPSEYTNSPAQIKNNIIIWPLFMLLNMFFLLLLCIFIVGYFRFRFCGSFPGKFHFQTVRFVPPSLKERADQRKGSDAHHLSCLSSAIAPSLAVHTNLGPGAVSIASLTVDTPLITAEDKFEAAVCDIRQQNVLIVYSHDSEAHERAVVALAEFLRDVFSLNISLDRWNLERIEQNFVGWLSASVVLADKVLVVNSAGTFERYRAKALLGGMHIVEKIESDPLDRIFSAHIDMALQHHSLISVRFNYTKAEQTLPMLNGLLQYILPENICPLLSAIFGHNMRHDERLSPFSLSSCATMSKLRESIDEMAVFCVLEPNWLNETHQRRRVVFDSISETKGNELNTTEFYGKNNVNANAIASGASFDGKTVNETELTFTSNLEQQQQQNSRKMDSGIFEWNGSDKVGDEAETDQGTIEAINHKKARNESANCENREMPAEEREAVGRSDCAGKDTYKVVNRADNNAEMDSGLIADLSPRFERKAEVFPIVAAL